MSEALSRPVHSARAASLSQPLALAVGIVVIGRNEGQRLVDCLASIPADLPLIYVDSGSTDGSVAAAEAVGAEVVALDMSVPFSAARARNEGARRLAEIAPACEAVQFLDGDTILQPGWLEAAASFLAERPEAVAVAGRRRERFPEASWYNHLCDIEWNTPIGRANAVGGDALYRLATFNAAGGFNPTVVCGEEPELCLRLRRAGGTVHRLDEEMTHHDAAIHRFGAWWKRAVRSGYAYAIGALLHGRSEDKYRVREVIRSLLWGAVLPLAVMVGIVTGVWWIFAPPAAALILKFLRLYTRFKRQMAHPARYAAFLMLSNVAEVFGIAKCFWEAITGSDRKILEYK